MGWIIDGVQEFSFKPQAGCLRLEKSRSVVLIVLAYRIRLVSLTFIEHDLCRKVQINRWIFNLHDYIIKINSLTSWKQAAGGCDCHNIWWAAICGGDGWVWVSRWRVELSESRVAEPTLFNFPLSCHSKAFSGLSITIGNLWIPALRVEDSIFLKCK